MPRRSYTKPSSRRARLCGRRAIVAATWNVRLLVERAGGDQRICRSRPQRQVPRDSNAVDGKLDLLVKELRRYSVSVAGIQETKWFGKDVWEGCVGC